MSTDKNACAKLQRKKEIKEESHQIFSFY